MNNIAIYGNGLFETDDSYLSDLMNSGVTTMVLWSLHVHPNGDLYYNDNLLVSQGKINFGTGPGQINPNMPADLQKLRTGGVAIVLFSIGAGGPPDPTDFHNIQTLLSTPQGTATLTANFKALAQGIGLDGFDYDCEEEGIEVSTITKLTQILTPLGNQRIITFCPYGVPSENFWLQCMSAIYKAMNQLQPVRWWNLQVYGGADPATWINQMKQYIKANPNNPIGVTNPNAFMVPGLEATSPSTVQQQFASWQKSGLGLQGGFIWNLTEIYQSGSTPKAYADAIAKGLAGQMMKAAG
jgi:hypothetical protein